MSDYSVCSVIHISIKNCHNEKELIFVQAGFTPGYYHDNSDMMTYDTLLEEFDAPAHLARDMLSGQGEFITRIRNPYFSQQI